MRAGSDWIGSEFRRGRGFGPAARGTYEGMEMGDASIVLAGLRISEKTLLVRDVFAYL